MSNKKEIVFVLDVDGTLTNGQMYYNAKDGKVMKSFGCDDFDALKTISEKIQIQFISGDQKGFEISKKRADEMNIPIALVPSNAQQRWDWIEQNFKDKQIVFMGDGINDYICLRKASISFTVMDALPHVLQSAKYRLDKRGGDRAVALACLILDEDLNLGCFPKELWEILEKYEV